VVDVLWRDGVMYYIFMFLIGVLNVGLTLQASHPQLQLGLSQLQTVLHSVLSTRILLHTAKVLRQDVIGSHATVAQNRWSKSMRFAEVTVDPAPEEVELQGTWR